MSIKENSHIEIEGIKFTPEMIDQMKLWYSNPELDRNAPERFVEMLNNIQDYFCRVIADASHETDISKEIVLMSNTIFIKDEMTVFIPKRKK